MTISHSGVSQARRNISLHHNVFAYNHERNPQIRGNVHHFNFVNNVVYNWKRFGGGYGVRLRERNGVFPRDINVINNFFSSQQNRNWAFILGTSPGDAPIPYPGDVYLSSNHFPAENMDSLGTVSSPIPTPQGLEVTTHTLSQLTTAMLPSVGTHYRTVEEQQILDEIVISINGIVTPTPADACSDGVDNDGDTLTDFPADPGCSSAMDNDESNVPQDPPPGAPMNLRIIN